MFRLRLLAPGFDAEELLRPIRALHDPGVRHPAPELWLLPSDRTDRKELLRSLLPVARRTGCMPALLKPGFRPRGFVFDLDSTLIACETIDRLAERYGIGESMRRLTARAMEGREDFRQSYARRLEMLKGMPLRTVEEEIGRLPLAPGAERLVRHLRERGAVTAIVTGGDRRAAEFIGRRLGIDDLHATELEVREGRLTGRTCTPLQDERDKAELLKSFCKRHGFSPDEVVAVGDGANDLAMLAEAGCAVLYNACPAPPAAGAPLDLLLSLFRPDDPERPGEKPLLP